MKGLTNKRLWFSLNNYSKVPTSPRLSIVSYYLCLFISLIVGGRVHVLVNVFFSTSILSLLSSLNSNMVSEPYRS